MRELQDVHEQEESKSTGEPPEADPRASQPAATPFDHPLALATLLAALTAWFFYDGFISRDEGMLENLTFNRGGFAVLAVATAWAGYKGWREMRAASHREDTENSDPSSPPR